MPLSDQEKLQLLELEQEQHEHEQTQQAQAQPAPTPTPQPQGEATPAPSDDVDLDAIKPQVGIGESALRGAVQGASFGFSDEGVGAFGAAKTAADQFLDNHNFQMDKIKESYTKSRDAERLANENAQKANPMTYGASELAGGMVTPGLGVLGTATKAAKGASTLARVGNAGINAARGSVIGGGSAALNAVGSSESSDPEVLAQQATEAGKTGAMIGAAPGVLGVGGALVHKPLGLLYDQVIKFQPARIVGEAIRKGYEGKDLTDLEAQFKKLDLLSKELGQAGLAQKKALSAEYEALKKTIANSPDRVDLGPYTNRLKEIEQEFRSIKSPKVHGDLDEVNDTIQNYTQGMPQPVPKINTAPGEEGVKSVIERFGGNEKLTQKELFDLQKLVGQQANPGSSKLATNEGMQFAKKADEGLKELSEQIPGLNPLNERYAALKNALGVFGIDAKEAFIKNAKTGQLEMNPSVLGKIQGAIRNAGTESAPKNQAQQALTLMLDNLEASGSKGTGQLRSKIAEHGDDFETARSIAGKNLSSQFGMLGFNVKNAAFLGNLVGKQAHDLQRIPTLSSNVSLTSATAKQAGRNQAEQAEDQDGKENHLATMSRNIYQLDDNQLTNVADLLKKNGSSLGDSLHKAVQGKDNMKKSATLFSIMQNPELRKLLNPTE